MLPGGRLAQCAPAVLMVRPAAFGANPETAASNAFQSRGAPTDEERRAALAEFDALANALTRAGVEVVVAPDTPAPPKPDAHFPNNWLSLHHDGTVVLYPMLAPSRRAERREAVLGYVAAAGFEPGRRLDLSGAEAHGRALEGTGSLVLDHAERTAYACLSPRTDAAELARFGELLGYTPHAFRASGPAGKPVYHTNVVLSVGEGFATLCAAAVDDDGERARLLASLERSGKEPMLINRAQMGAFAGNLLQLAAARGGRVIALSASAWAALDARQRAMLERHGAIASVAVPTIERFGGGSVRCMLAEIFLPRAGNSTRGDHASAARLT